MENLNALPVIIIGGGIGGLASALSMARQGFYVQVLEKSSHVGEIGAGLQAGPNALSALDSLGIGDRARQYAQFVDYIIMQDAIHETPFLKLKTGIEFRRRFGNSYAVFHRYDLHSLLLDEVIKTGKVEIYTDTHINQVKENSNNNVSAIDQNGKYWNGQFLIGADGAKSAIRAQFVNDSPCITEILAYRAVIDKKDFPESLKSNAASLWAGPNYHIVHYPLRGGEQFNLVILFQGSKKEQWRITNGSQEELEHHIREICPKAFPLIHLPQTYKCWPIVDREPIEEWQFGRVILLGDAAHLMTPYLAQGASMALEDAVTLGEALRVSHHNWNDAFALYKKNRVLRTARVVFSCREMGRMYHFSGIESKVRNMKIKAYTQQKLYDNIQWLYGWNAQNCLKSY
jgi:2-polyprenyl-6-methoxyphenol hydroxylase-like FAD-dependent oxidoreductase